MSFWWKGSALRSSYIQHDYASMFRALLRGWQPRVLVELGVLDGYSTTAIAQGLRDNASRKGTAGHLAAYDLFEAYPYTHSNQHAVQSQLDAEGLTAWVTLHEANVYEDKVHEQYQHGQVDFLHVDLSNDGDTIRRIMQDWDDKMVVGGTICFEGGTEERDQVEWMVKYDKPSIREAIETEPRLNTAYVYATCLKPPGLTTCLKKRHYDGAD
jgi:hypothetical protein